MIEEIIVENFKCFRNRKELKLSQINIIIGEPEKGKSTIIHSVKLCMKSFLLDPIIRDLDFSIDEVKELLPDMDLSKRIHIHLRGNIELPFVYKPVKYDIDMSLSASDGTLSTGIEIEDAKITRSEMLQAMFSYIIKEYNYEKYSIKIEAHYLSHCVYNLKVVYPRITIMDKELFIILYQDIFPNLLKDRIRIVNPYQGVACYSINPIVDDPFTENYKVLLVDPQVKHNVSRLLSKIYGRDVVIDIRRIKNRDEYVVEDITTSRPISTMSTTFRNVLNIAIVIESTPKTGTVIIDDYDRMIPGSHMANITDILVKRCLERGVQLILTANTGLDVEKTVEKLREALPSEQLNIVML
ncbi:MAG: AAA family ATPase [Crenarchaeota archaeon]|nr:AAA family ATPase [Thermoproteota archaeon]